MALKIVLCYILFIKQHLKREESQFIRFICREYKVIGSIDI
jgi:hypothetical protein